MRNLSIFEHDIVAEFDTEFDTKSNYLADIDFKIEFCPDFEAKLYPKVVFVSNYIQVRP